MTRAEIAAVKIRQAIQLAFPNHTENRVVSAILTAAGSGERMGGVSKALYPLNGSPCISFSLGAFQACKEIEEIIVVAKSEDADTIRRIAKDYSITKLKKIVSGGATRQESVEKGFLAIHPKADLVAIHDAARPLITPSDIRSVLRDAIRFGAATAAKKITDTVKRSDESKMILETVPREDLYTVQTPQIFLCDLYRVSLALAKKDGVSVTDDNALAEHAGFKVKLSLLENENDKLTFPADVHRIEQILKERL